MAVLVEATSVILQVGTIRERYAGGWVAFADRAPNSTLCSDNELARVGFMTPADCQTFIDYLNRTGLIFLRDGESIDIAVADQMRGFTARCGWADFGKIELKPGQTVSAAQLPGTQCRQVFCPEGWKYEGSLSAQFGFVPTGQEDKSLKFLRHEDGMDIYLNLLTGKEIFVGRSDAISR